MAIQGVTWMREKTTFSPEFQEQIIKLIEDRIKDGSISKIIDDLQNADGHETNKLFNYSVLFSLFKTAFASTGKWLITYSNDLKKLANVQNFTSLINNPKFFDIYNNNKPHFTEIVAKLLGLKLEADNLKNIEEILDQVINITNILKDNGVDDITDDKKVITTLLDLIKKEVTEHNNGETPVITSLESITKTLSTLLEKDPDLSKKIIDKLCIFPGSKEHTNIMSKCFDEIIKIQTQKKGGLINFEELTKKYVKAHKSGFLNEYSLSEILSNNFRHTTIDTSLSGFSFKEINFESTTFTNPNFQGSKFKNVNFYNSEFVGAIDFTNCEIDAYTLASMLPSIRVAIAKGQKVKLNAKIIGNLKDMDLSGIDFSEADFTKANFDKTNLTGTTLSDALFTPEQINDLSHKTIGFEQTINHLSDARYEAKNIDHLRNLEYEKLIKDITKKIEENLGLEQSLSGIIANNVQTIIDRNIPRSYQNNPSYKIALLKTFLESGSIAKLSEEIKESNDIPKCKSLKFKEEILSNIHDKIKDLKDDSQLTVQDYINLSNSFYAYEQLNSFQSKEHLDIALSAFRMAILLDPKIDQQKFKKSLIPTVSRLVSTDLNENRAPHIISQVLNENPYFINHFTFKDHLKRLKAEHTEFCKNNKSLDDDSYEIALKKFLNTHLNENFLETKNLMKEKIKPYVGWAGTWTNQRDELVDKLLEHIFANQSDLKNLDSSEMISKLSDYLDSNKSILEDILKNYNKANHRFLIDNEPLTQEELIAKIAKECLGEMQKSAAKTIDLEKQKNYLHNSLIGQVKKVQDEIDDEYQQLLEDKKSAIETLKYQFDQAYYNHFKDFTSSLNDRNHENSRKADEINQTLIKKEKKALGQKTVSEILDQEQFKLTFERKESEVNPIKFYPDEVDDRANLRNIFNKIDDKELINSLYNKVKNYHQNQKEAIFYILRENPYLVSEFQNNIDRQNFETKFEHMINSVLYAPEYRYEFLLDKLKNGKPLEQKENIIREEEKKYLKENLSILSSKMMAEVSSNMQKDKKTLFGKILNKIVRFFAPGHLKKLYDSNTLLSNFFESFELKHIFYAPSLYKDLKPLYHILSELGYYDKYVSVRDSSKAYYSLISNIFKIKEFERVLIDPKNPGKPNPNLVEVIKAVLINTEKSEYTDTMRKIAELRQKMENAQTMYKEYKKYKSTSKKAEEAEEQYNKAKKEYEKLTNQLKNMDKPNVTEEANNLVSSMIDLRQLLASKPGISDLVEQYLFTNDPHKKKILLSNLSSELNPNDLKKILHIVAKIEKPTINYLLPIPTESKLDFIDIPDKKTRETFYKYQASQENNRLSGLVPIKEFTTFKDKIYLTNAILCGKEEENIFLKNIISKDFIFQNSTLKYVDLSNSEFASDAKKKHSSFTQSKIESCRFDNTQFSKVSFDHSKFLKTNFTKTSFSNCNFKDNLIEDVKFDSAKFNGCNFSEVKLHNVEFNNMDLSSIDFRKIQISGTLKINQCKLSKESKEFLDKLKAKTGKNVEIKTNDKSIDHTNARQLQESISNTKGISIGK